MDLKKERENKEWRKHNRNATPRNKVNREPPNQYSSTLIQWSDRLSRIGAQYRFFHSNFSGLSVSLPKIKHVNLKNEKHVTSDILVGHQSSFGHEQITRHYPPMPH